MQVHSFLDSDTETYTHVLADTEQRLCAIVDPVLNFDAKSGRTNTSSVDEVIEFVREQEWTLRYIIETHAHADHLSAAIHVKESLGGQLVIGQHITEVQKIFKQIFNFDTSFRTDASQFDILTDEGETLELGNITITAQKKLNRLILHVIDNGDGQSNTVSTGFGIGMSNTKARLDAMFNGDYEISISDNEQQGTTVTISVPFENL